MSKFVPDDTIDKLLQIVYEHLYKNGIVVMRRLNSDINLVNTLRESKLFKILEENVMDKSFFYKEVIIARKIE